MSPGPISTSRGRSEREIKTRGRGGDSVLQSLRGTRNAHSVHSSIHTVNGHHLHDNH